MTQHKETYVREKQAVFDIPSSPGKAIIILVAFGLFFTIRYYLPLGDLEEGLDADRIRTGLAILTLAATLWLTEALPLALTALLIPVMASLSRALDVPGSFSGFSHPLIFLFLGGFGLAAALSRQGIDRWIALRILALGRGNFHMTAIAMFLVSAVLSMWISNTATVALLLPVALGILRSLSSEISEQQSQRAAVFLLLGIAYSASIGGIGTLMFTATSWTQPVLRDNRLVHGLGGCGAARSHGGFESAIWRDQSRRKTFQREAWATTRLILICLIPAFAAEYWLNQFLAPDALGVYFGTGAWMAVPLAVIVGAPAYLDGYAALPLVRGLMDAGMGSGAAMAFLISGGVVSIWGAMAIFPVLRLKPFLLYLAFAVVGSMLAGWGFEVFA